METMTDPISWEGPAENQPHVQFRVEQAEAAKLEAEVDTLRERLASDEQSRRLRYPIAIGALLVMVLQVVVSNAIFGWYGDANAWDISAAAISAWMGTTVVEVVAVVLVVMNYLFPNRGRKYA
jgi:predicted Kef-type K+ transport protein